jgi:hypothetical protein
MDKAAILAKINTDQRWLERAILALDARQTEDERQSGQTVHDNDKGWNAYDASLGTYLANYLRSGRHLSGQWVTKARNMVRKYAGQLARIAAAKQAAKQHAEAALAALDV